MDVASVNAFEQVLKDYQFFANQQLRTYSEIIEEANKVFKIHTSKNSKRSHAFNVLDFFDIGETTHSAIIATLLNPGASHGQDIFLKTFLELNAIENGENDKWVVTAEKGRIDILLVRQYPHSVVIIENKSNNAIDQESQLYRYWYNAIFLPNKSNAKYLDESFYIKEEISNKYKIVYLSPDGSKYPNESSLKKPITLSKNVYLPDRLPMPIHYWNFKEHIVKWLFLSYRRLPYQNYRLKEFIRQYIQHWK